MAPGKSHSCATHLAKVGLLMSGSQRCSWVAQRCASSVWPHMKCCYLRTDGSVMRTYNKEDCKPGDYILLQEPMQVVDYGCCVRLTPFCGRFPVRSTEWCRLCCTAYMYPVWYSLLQTTLRYHRKSGCILLVRTVHPSAFQLLQLPAWISGSSSHAGSVPFPVEGKWLCGWAVDWSFNALSARIKWADLCAALRTESCISKNTSTFHLFTFTYLLNHAYPHTDSPVVDKEYIFSVYFYTETWSLLQIKQLGSIKNFSGSLWLGWLCLC